jgi:hypothetical protein
MTSTAVYRAIMQVVEARRVELNISMATVVELSGVNEGYYAKMIYPDSPSGRQAQWRQVQDVLEALFGRDFEIKIEPGTEENRRLLSAPRIDENASGNARKIRHWRHRKHFSELGRLGGVMRAKLPKRKLTAIARKANKIRWKRIKDAKRQGEAHKKVNETKRELVDA